MGSLANMHLPFVNTKEELEQISKNKFRPLFDVSLFEIREETKDKGIDYIIELKKSGKYSGFKFNIQLKATNSIKQNKDGSYSLQIETSNINYLLNSAIPSYYILYDMKGDCFFYEYIKDFVESLQTKSKVWNKKPTHVLRFSKKITNEVIFEIYDFTFNSGMLLRKFAEKISKNKPRIKISNQTSLSYSDKVYIKLKRKLIAFRMLRWKQSNYVDAVNMIENIIKEAKKNEAYNILTEALLIKKYYVILKNELPQFEKINAEINFYDSCFKALIHSADTYFFFLIYQKPALSAKFKYSIAQVEKNYKKTNSQQINYYLHILKMTFYEQKRDYKNAILLCKGVISVIKNNQFLYQNERIGFALSNLSNFQVSLGDYTGGLKSAKRAQKFYAPNSGNYIKSKEQEFYAYHYSGNISQATKCLEEILEFPIDFGEFQKSKFIYYQACLLFIQKKYKNALSLLNKSLEIEKDRSRWNISLRIVRIMIFIELNKINEAYGALESLRKVIQRYNTHGEIKERDFQICKVLMELGKNEFIYNITNKNLARLLSKLSGKNKSTLWEHYTSELIPFHRWMINQKEKQMNIIMDYNKDY